MKNSYLLNCLVATLRENLRVISNSKYDVFVTELINDNFYSIRNGMWEITDKGAEDAFVTKYYNDCCYKIKMDFYAKKTHNLSKDQYLSLLRKVIDEVIDNAARQGYAIEGDTVTAEPEATPAPPAADETPGDKKKPSKPSRNAEDLEMILARILSDLDRIIEILERYEKNN